ncbi:flagellar FliL protein [Marinobacter zhejiangensis]|uniref:Flagellar protein FliL n=2 Tax=Marinobacter zhejiangensis TaxID=488535 RepID=A0A1I4MC72_9GAMM|nr:flagellar FliL protein [Marinobacter zhejiangensis]
MNFMSLFRVLALLCLLPLTTSPALAESPDDSEENSTAEEARVTDYIEMEPDFVTNVGAPDQKLKYLKAAVTLRASSPTTRAAVEAHMPRLRHELVLLFGEQTDLHRLTSNEGKEALKDEAVRRINAVLEEQQTGEQIDDVVFTTFVVQR